MILFHNLVSDVGMCICTEAASQCKMLFLFGVTVKHYPRESSSQLSGGAGVGAPAKLSLLLSLEGPGEPTGF